MVNKMYSLKQFIIINHLKANEQITLADAVKLIGFGIYCNQSFYVGQVLCRMVKRGFIKRVRRGVYKISEPERAKVAAHDSNQENQGSLL